MNTSPLSPRPARPRTGARLAMAAAVAAVGLTASIVWAAVGLSDQTRRPAEMVTTTTPGSVTVQISRPGTHVVYLESAVPTAVRDLDPILGLTPSDLTVTGPDGRPSRSARTRSTCGTTLLAAAPASSARPSRRSTPTGRATTSWRPTSGSPTRPPGSPSATTSPPACCAPSCCRCSPALLALVLAVVLAVRALILAGGPAVAPPPNGGAR